MARRWIALLLLLVSCTGAKGDADQARETWLRYHKAVLAGDREGLKADLATSAAAELDGPGADEELKLLQAMAPKDVEVGEIRVDGDTATLDLRAGEATGQATLVRQEGRWKVSREEWTLALEAVDFLAAGAPGVARRLEGHQGAVTSLAFADDRLVSASSDDYTVRAWTLPEGRPAGLVTLEDRPSDLALARGKVLVLAGDRLVEIPLGPEGLGTPVPGLTVAGQRLAVASDGALLAVAPPVRVYRDGNLLRTLEGTENLRAVAFSRDGRRLAAAGGNRVVVWDTRDWSERRFTLNKVQDGEPGDIAFGSDGRRLAVAHMDSSVVVLDLESGEETANTFVRDASGFAVAFAPGGSAVATGHQDGGVYLWKPDDGKRLHRLAEHREAATSLAFSPDGSTLASGGKDRRILLWQAGATAPPPASSAPPRTAAPSAPPAPSLGQTNLLRPEASRWRTDGDATVETLPDGRPCFAVRYGGFFWQDAFVKPESAGRWAALVARTSTERVNAGGDITGLPYLYGNFVDAADDHHFLGYMQEDSMRCAATEADTWVPVSGVFQIPPQTGRLRVFLNQASGQSAQTGSAARFTDVGVYLFESEAAGRAFASGFR